MILSMKNQSQQTYILIQNHDRPILRISLTHTLKKIPLIKQLKIITKITNLTKSHRKNHSHSGKIYYSQKINFNTRKLITKTINLNSHFLQT
jgi:hypothetical protein